MELEIGRKLVYNRPIKKDVICNSWNVRQLLLFLNLHWT